MLKSVSLSFDDGRKDVYTNVYPIIQKYGLTGTINVVTDFVDHPEKCKFKSCKYGGISEDELAVLYDDGFEIAAHGHTHQNTIDDVLICLNRLRQYGIKDEKIGFASPNSYYCDQNISEIRDLISDGHLYYIRTGIQTKREGLLYAALTLFERKSHSRWLYYMLNRKCIFRCGQGRFVSSVSVTSSTTVEQIKYFINRMADDENVIFNFHSVLGCDEAGYGIGDWYWDKIRFEELCKWLSDSDVISVKKTIDMIGGPLCTT